MGMPNRRQIEKLDSAERLQLLVKAVKDYAIVLLSPDGTVLSWNAGAQRLTGYKEQQIIGRSHADFYTPEDLALERPCLDLETAAKEGKIESEGWFVKKDGSRFWALTVIEPVYDQGDVIGFAFVTRDLTERRNALNALRESEQSFRRLVEAVVDYAIFQLDRNGIVTTWNPGAQHIKGYEAAEIIGKHFSCFYTEEDQAKGVPQQVLATAAREGRFEAESWRVRKDGSRFFASVVIDPIFDADGALVGFAKITRDVTDRMKNQLALKEAQEQLAVAQKMEAVGQLSGGIAHDFNNLMMIVLGNLETAQRNASDNPHLQRSLKNAMRGAQRATSLTSRLLAFSRRQPLNPKPVSLNDFLQGAVDFIKRSLGETIDVESVGSDGLWLVEVDPNHLETALLNLAINARDAMPEGGKLTVEARNTSIDSTYCRTNPEFTAGQYVAISVSDTGHGMTADVLGRAFEPFFTTKQTGQGTGLGLSQVYGFVKQSGGQVKIYSEPSHGTTVKIYLPRLTSTEFQEEGATERLIEGEQGETILVVEDDVDLRAYLSEVLSGLNYRVLVASGHEAALSFAGNSGLRIDVMLTDVVMPGMNGRELADKVRTIRPDLKIIYMSGYSQNAIVHGGRLDKGVELLEKPISQAALASRLRDVLEQG
jgi:PAS domain S-box-containing protein